MNQISKLNDETDWNSMSDLEKVRVFEERYEKAFPNKNVIFSGLYQLCSPEYAAITNHCSQEAHKIFDTNGRSNLEENYTVYYRQIRYPDMTDEEVISAIQDKYQGTGSMEDKSIILSEYIHCGIASKADYLVLSEIRMQVFSKVESTYGPSLDGKGISVSQSPRFLSWYTSFAKGTGEGAGYKPNWTQITQEIYDTYSSNDQISKEYLEKIKNSLDQFLDEILGKKKEESYEV